MKIEITQQKKWKTDGQKQESTAKQRKTKFQRAKAAQS